jgi:hypothetical protein
MTNDSAPLEQARELLRLAPPLGAEARVLRRVLEGKPRQERRPLRPLVLLFSLLLSTAAAAGFGPTLVHWMGVWRQTERPPSAAVRAHATSSARPASRHATRALVPPPSAAATPAPTELGTAETTTLPPSSERSVPTAAVGAPSAAPMRLGAAAPSAAPAEAAESMLAREVSAYREAAALVAVSPGLALVRLLAHREHFPSSALAPEVSLRIVQAFTALGRDAEARREARSFVIRFPSNAKRAEMEAVADGAPLERPGQ